MYWPGRTWLCTAQSTSTGTLAAATAAACCAVVAEVVMAEAVADAVAEGLQAATAIVARPHTAAATVVLAQLQVS